MQWPISIAVILFFVNLAAAVECDAGKPQCCTPVAKPEDTSIHNDLDVNCCVTGGDLVKGRAGRPALDNIKSFLLQENNPNIVFKAPVGSCGLVYPKLGSDERYEYEHESGTGALWLCNDRMKDQDGELWGITGREIHDYLDSLTQRCLLTNPERIKGQIFSEDGNWNLIIGSPSTFHAVHREGDP